MKKQTPYDYMMQALERNRKRGTAPRMDNGDLEHDIRCSCIKWFRAQYPQLSKLLFAVPNGGFRNKATAGKMKAEGVVAGVSDILYPASMVLRPYAVAIVMPMMVKDIIDSTEHREKIRRQAEEIERQYKNAENGTKEKARQ